MRRGHAPSRTLRGLGGGGARFRYVRHRRHAGRKPAAAEPYGYVLTRCYLACATKRAAVRFGGDGVTAREHGERRERVEPSSALPELGAITTQATRLGRVEPHGQRPELGARATDHVLRMAAREAPFERHGARALHLHVAFDAAAQPLAQFVELLLPLDQNEARIAERGPQVREVR